MTAKTETAAEVLARFPDEFNGDNAHLVQCIEALLSLDAKGSLVPHGIGGHARGLLSAAMHRLERALSAQGEVVVTRAEDGEIVMVSRQDRDGKTIGIIASTTHAGGKAQREAVAWGQFEEGQLVATSFKRNEESGCTVPLYPHPAPARVTEETTREAVAEALRRWPDAEASILFMVGAIGPLGNVTKSDIEWARTAALEDGRHG